MINLTYLFKDVFIVSFMGDVVKDLTQRVAFVLSEKSDHDEWENWKVAEGLVFGGGNNLEYYIRACLAKIPQSAMRRCDPSGLGYLAKRICGSGWPKL